MGGGEAGDSFKAYALVCVALLFCDRTRRDESPILALFFTSSRIELAEWTVIYKVVCGVLSDTWLWKAGRFGTWWAHLGEYVIDKFERIVQVHFDPAWRIQYGLSPIQQQQQQQQESKQAYN